MRYRYPYPKRSLLIWGCALLVITYWYFSSRFLVQPQDNVLVSSSLFGKGAVVPAMQTVNSKKRLADARLLQVKASANQILFEPNISADSNLLVTGRSSTGQLAIYQDGFLLFTTIKHKKNTAKDKQPPVESHTWGVQLLGANKAFDCEVKQELVTKVTRLTADGSRSTATYGEVVLTQVYKGIDLRLYSQKNGNLEFDWIIAPGADVDDISLQYKGQDSLKVKEDGGLEVALRFGKVHFNIPESYQLRKDGEKQPIEAKYAMINQVSNVVGYQVPDVDTALPLVIDPEVVWATYIDGNRTDFDGYLYTLDVDNAGNIYCGGYVNDQKSIVNTMAPYNSIPIGYQGTLSQDWQPVIYKVKADGSTITRITYINGGDRIASLALSPSQNVLFAIGHSIINAPPPPSPDAPEPPALATLPVSATSFDVSKSTTGIDNGFVIALDAATLGNSGEGGHLYYASYLDYYPRDILPLSDDSYVIGGETLDQSSNAIPYTSAAGVPVPTAGEHDGIIQKFTSYGTLSWGTYLGCDDGYISALKLLSDNRIAFVGGGGYDAGRTRLVNAAGSYDPTAWAAAVGVIDNNAGSTWSMFSLIGAFGGDYLFTSLDVKINSPGNDEIWFCGSGRGTGLFPGTAGAYRSAPVGSDDFIVAKLPQTGKTGSVDPLKATYLGGTDWEQTPCVRVINNGNDVMVYGSTFSTNYPTKNNVFGGPFYQATNSSIDGTCDMVLSVLDASLTTLTYSTYIGGNSAEYLREVNRPLVVLPDQETFLVATTSHSISAIKPDIFSAGGFDHDPNSNPEDKHLLLKLRLNNIIAKDYGDMPVIYGKAEHRITAATYNGTTPRLALGQKLDIEGFYSTAVPVAAEGDDVTVEQTSVGDDEDAFSGTLPAVSGATYTLANVPVTNTTGGDVLVYGFIDFNNDGDFIDPGEETLIVVPNGATSFTITWSGYGDGTAARYVRLRIAPQASWTALTTPTARSAAVIQEGEVEDHTITGSVLPLTLKNFTVFWEQDHSVGLKWMVEQEREVKNYVVQRSSDGSNWQVIGTVVAQGGGTRLLYYQYKDDLNAVYNTVFYRIQYIDAGGVAHYSKVERLSIQAGGNDIRVRPNPFKDYFVLDFKEPGLIGQLQLLDLQGRVVQKVDNSEVIMTKTIRITNEQLPPGMYILEVNYGGQRYYYKLSKNN